MGDNHNHAQFKTVKSLAFVLSLNLIFFFVEAIGGYVIGSLALIADAAHMLTDVTALTIALIATKLSYKAADASRTYGYYRFEILAAALNACLLFIVTIYILYEAYERLNTTPDLQSTYIIAIASMGFVVNLISLYVLLQERTTNMNIKAAYLEVFSDTLSSAGVIIGATIIYFTGWMFVDSIIGVLIGIWILPRAWSLLKESINILLEGVPAGIDLAKIKDDMLNVKGVLDIHDLHVWGITNERINLTAHVVIDQQSDCAYVVTAMRNLLKEKYHIDHSTIQDEKIKCLDDDRDCSLH